MIREKNNTPDKNDRGFDEILLEPVDAALSLGENVKHIIYFYLERRYSIRRVEIPGCIEEFRNALAGILRAGSTVLEKMIVRNLYGKLGLISEPQQNWTLAQHVNHAKKHMKPQYTQTRHIHSPPRL